MSDEYSFTRDPAQAREEGRAIDAGLRDHMQRIYNRMALGVFTTAVVAFFVGHNNELLQLFLGGPQRWLIILAPLAIVFFGFNPARMSSNAMRISFFALSALYGVSFAAIFVLFTGESIAQTFFVAAAMFAGLSIYGYTTRKDLSGMGSFMIMGMWGIFVLAILNMFIESTVMGNVIAAVGIVVFAGLTAWDTQRLKEMYSSNMNPEIASRMAWMGALSLYIDFIAMFQYILHFMGNRN